MYDSALNSLKKCCQQLWELMPVSNLQSVDPNTFLQNLPVPKKGKMSVKHHETLWPNSKFEFHMFFFAITGSVSTQIQNQNLMPSLFVGYILHDNTTTKANDRKKRKETRSTNTFLLLPLFSALCHIHMYSQLSSILNVMLHGSGLKECSNKKTNQTWIPFGLQQLLTLLSFLCGCQTN